ncbi:DUF1285 domain-containing protein [Aurantiacibacter gangjinensis]|uniref:Proteophosphoglycan n=1 Tax=Aurantiacibacter gangjinensis TaxID=502682 RepID=A0A0G9MVB7_9SPHN|nr:DUF1285 domain-containing protein [Aurantiacibacter gangjinensis]APE29177.1 Proteophosphoglycan precursor [Aurantiacibacter gangjinensis]KLE33243.1 proteophosphoglycan precursor [Aurantiacibacter gangjinensis]
MVYTPPPELAGLSLAEIAQAVGSRGLPPVDQWKPEATSDSRMRIAADGTWYHDGSPVARPAMVRAFASLLWRDPADGQHYLVTPHYRQTIEVEDAAFRAVDMQVKDGALAFRLNTDELVIAGPDHPLRAEGDAEAPAIYLHVRHGCEARLDRSTWLQLAEHALAGGDDLAVHSQGAAFSLVPR